MKPQTAAGVLIGGLFIAATFFVPGLLRTDATSREARQQAEQARRELSAYNFGLSQHVRSMDAETLRSADLDALVSAQQSTFDALGQRFQEVVRRAKGVSKLGENRGLPPSTLAARGAGSAGVRSALSELDGRLKQNDALLSSARSHATTAAQADREAPGAAMVLGSVEFTRAAESLAQAQVLRARLDEKLSQLVRAARELGTFEIEKRHFQALDAKPALEQIATQISEVETLQAGVRQEVDKLSGEIAKAKSELTGIREKLQTAQAELLALEGGGFEPGSDASFEAFRQRYQNVSDALRGLSDQEQRIAFGGLSGAKPVESDEEGAITGGEPVVGLEELERRLAAAQDAAARLERGRAALQSQAEAVRTDETAARQGETASAERSKKQLAVVEQIRGEVVTLAEEALKREDEALQSARAAERAFGDAGRAQASLVSAASKEKSDYDTTGKNERLKRITGDSLGKQFPEGAEAQTRTLIGRLLALRVSSLEHLVAASRRVGEFAPNAAFETKELEKSLTEAREAGGEALTKAITWYERAGNSGATAWIYLASAAYAHHQVATIDPKKRSAALAEALAAITKAVTKRDKSPFLAPHLAFFRMMGGTLQSAAPPAEGDAAGKSPEAPAADTPAPAPDKPADPNTEEPARPIGDG